MIEATINIKKITKNKIHFFIIKIPYKKIKTFCNDKDIKKLYNSFGFA
jgi:hypothetical protein